MDTTAIHSPAHRHDIEALAECIAPLDAEDRYALQRYWDRVIWAESVPRSQRVERVPSFAELDERRAQRRTRRLSAAATESTRSEAGAGPDAA